MVELASQAYEHTTALEIKAESCYLKARVHHAMGSLGEAKLLYIEACNLWPQFPPAQYGMAQMLVYEGNIEAAVKALDAVLAEIPDNQVQTIGDGLNTCELWRHCRSQRDPYSVPTLEYLPMQLTRSLGNCNSCRRLWYSLEFSMPETRIGLLLWGNSSERWSLTLCSQTRGLHRLRYDIDNSERRAGDVSDFRVAQHVTSDKPLMYLHIS